MLAHVIIDYDIYTYWTRDVICDGNKCYCELALDENGNYQTIEWSDEQMPIIKEVS